MIGLVWNGMLSFGGRWFFLARRRRISVSQPQLRLARNWLLRPAASITEGNIGHILIAILTMIVMVVGVNVVFWRPLVAWAEKFRVETSEAAEQPRSITLDLLRRSQIPAMIPGRCDPSAVASTALPGRLASPSTPCTRPDQAPGRECRLRSPAVSAGVAVRRLQRVHLTSTATGSSVKVPPRLRSRLPHVLPAS